MEHADQRPPGTEPPGDRLSRLSQASLRINESLDVDTALQAVMESARSLTDAPYAVIARATLFMVTSLLSGTVLQLSAGSGPLQPRQGRWPGLR